ncbi:BQ5605_C015g07855 [Microbotryum silenes-dioicae]|uniref:BQ5605_C015g07840 protein n=1 Tax=Microbotryum silenes-dioicae TaxID=796604 RepID=A0A2X0LSZ0_9BASI|nr:BQ5605_C015g07840 [Microbotryum silenes-dioicae]SGY17682.1 BQ5605_C015g07855 [Microbotryum silenes-dioicae]
MSVQTPRPVRRPPASRASPTTPAPNHSTNPTTDLPAGRLVLANDARRSKLFWAKVLTTRRTYPRPVQIEVIAVLSKLDQFGNRDRYDAVFVTAPTSLGKSVIFEALYLIYGRRAVSIVVSPLYALSNHPGKKAVVVSEETWRDGELYRQLDDPNPTISFILIVCAG